MSNHTLNHFGDWWIEDNILCMKYKNGLFIDVNMARIIVEERHKITDFKASLCYADISTIKGVSSEARNYFSSEHATKYVLAGALLTNSLLAKMIGNFFLKVNFSKTKTPNKIFSNKETAFNWLKSLKFEEI